MRIAVGGAGAIGGSIAYHLALRGADVVICDRRSVAAGASGRALGGVRQQFSSPAEVRLAQESIRFFEELGTPRFSQVGYLFLATSTAGADELARRRERQRELGVPVDRIEPGRLEQVAPGVRADDVRGAVFCARDGLADPAAVTHELVRRAVSLGAELREGLAVEDAEADCRVIACGAESAQAGTALGVELPVRPLSRQLLETQPLEGIHASLPMVVESETGFHFRPRDGRLIVAMGDQPPRWGARTDVDQSVFSDRLARLAHRFPAAACATVDRSWAGLYDMTPDAHPIIGEVAPGLIAACGFSGHGFMQSPAVGRAVSELILDGRSELDLTPYALARFSGAAFDPEQVVL